MSQKLREQISALCDHELPEGEHELLMRRFAVEKSLRQHWGRYHLIGAAMRKELPDVDTRGLADRVMSVIAEEQVNVAHAESTVSNWSRQLLRGTASVAVAASVAVLAIVGLNHGAMRHGAAPGEVVPSAVAHGGEASPVDFTNSASWSGDQLPMPATLDSSLVDQEGASPALGKHDLQSHRPAASRDSADQKKDKGPDQLRPPRRD
ncbi:MAG TPA: sigma-E factor negative regulatory protein [Gammaproteobacteria bacterium]|nr:sigma-E factor negative regulatory protein [Gammaproteobacteria bacterium]